MKQIGSTALPLIGLVFLGTMVCTLAWNELVVGVVFHCTDSLPFTFVRPGDSVHPGAVDTFSAGWTTTGLWCLWGSMVGAMTLGPVRLMIRARRNTKTNGSTTHSRS